MARHSGCVICGKEDLTVSEKSRIPRVCDDCRAVGREVHAVNATSAIKVRNRRSPNPFRPPSYVKEASGSIASFYELVRKLAKFLTIAFAITIIGLPVAVMPGVLWLTINAAQRRTYTRTQQWFEDLASSRGAALADIGVYMGGHPLLPLTGQCALYLTQNELLLELEEGQEAVVSLASIESIDSGVETIHAEGLFGVPTEFAWSNMYFLVAFRDDTGVTNKVRLAGTLAASGHEWAAVINSARYAAERPSPRPGARPGPRRRRRYHRQ